MTSEKNSRLLSDREYGVLLGDLRSLGLVDTARLYLVGGLPQMFKCVACEAGEQFQDSWLYVPISQVRSLRQTVLVESSSVSRSGISRHPVQADTTKLYPIVCGGVFAGFLSIPRGEPFKLDDVTESLLERLEAHISLVHSETSSIVRDFVRRLYQRDQGFQQFSKAALELITSQWDHSMGAVYYDNQGVYNMRMAVGDIQLGHVLPSEIKPNVAREWIDAVRRGESFVPADLLPDSPHFLSVPPAFVFVHPGSTSKRTEYLLAVALTGDASHQAVTNMQEVAGLLSDLDENQFASTAGVTELFSHLGELIQTAPGLDEIAIDLFKRLVRHVSLSRVQVISSSGPATEVRKRNLKEPEVSIEPDMPVPSAAVTAVREERPILLEDVRKRSENEQLGKKYFFDDVVAELVFPLRWSGKDWAMATFGTSVGGAYLDEHWQLLEFSARYLETCLLLMNRARWQKRVDTSDSSRHQGHSSAAMDGIRSRLTDGILHALLEQLSVVLGQGEIMEEEFTALGPGEQEVGQLEGTRRINRAAAAIAEYVGHLRWLQTLSESGTGDEMLDLAELCEIIPEVMQGCVHDLRSRKRIEVRIVIEADGGKSVNVSRNHFVEIMLPLLVTLLDEAICTDRIVLRPRGDSTGPEVQLRFSRNLIGHLDMAELVGKVYPDHQLEVGGDSAGRAKLASGTLDYRLEDGQWLLQFSFGSLEVGTSGEARDRSGQVVK